MNCSEGIVCRVEIPMKIFCSGHVRLALAAALLLLTPGSWTAAFGQVTPSDDAYVNSAAPTTNYGAATTLDISSAADTSFIRFDLAAVPAGYTGASIAKATLKLYVNTVTTAGSFNVDLVNGTWTEKTLKYSNEPALGTTIVASVPLATTSKGTYVEIDITSAVVGWLNNAQPNDGIALVANSPLVATLDSKENTSASHAPEIDIVYAGIAGVTTASGSGLTGGGTSGVLNLALTNGCAAKQVLEWNGSSWACAAVGTGTVTSVGLSAPSSDFTVSGSPVTSSGTLNFAWGVAPTSADTANAIVKRDSSGNFTASTITAANVTVTNALSVSSAAGYPLSGTSSFSGATVTSGNATSTTGEAWGVEGYTASSAGTAYGVIGEAGAASGNPIGVFGLVPNSAAAIGVFGQDGNESASALSLSVGGGVWGDGGRSSFGIGVIGTVDNGYAGFFENNSPTGYFTVDVVAQNAASFPFIASGPNGYCEVDFDGNLDCSGAKNAVVPIDGGKRIVAMSAVESPQNWFEDAGAAELVNGSAVVTLDRDFIQTVNTEMDYKVFPVPNGDCKGLYVTNKTATSFEIRELGGGTSSIRFDYRIMALRKKYENVRFADHTHDLDGHKQMLERAHATGAAHPQSHVPTKKLSLARPLMPTTALK
jgi:hypothetical protein